MTVEIKFDLPYSLNVEGNFTVRAAGETFEVTLVNDSRQNPVFQVPTPWTTLP